MTKLPLKKARMIRNHLHSFLAIVTIVSIIAISIFIFYPHSFFYAERWLVRNWFNAAAIAAGAAVFSLILQIIYHHTDNRPVGNADYSASRATILTRARLYRNELRMRAIPRAADLELVLKLRHDPPQQGSSTFKTESASEPIHNIGKFFDDVGYTLMLLGNPGSGKTSMLIELSEEISSDGDANQLQLIPILLKLNTWSSESVGFYDWLVDEISDPNGPYRATREATEQWINTDKLTLLLDGLDEVASKDRDGCYSAIREFLSIHGTARIAISCRSDDFPVDGTRLLGITSVVEIQPPTREEVLHVLTELEAHGIKLAHVRMNLDRDEQLWKFLMSPLVLAVLAQSYVGDPAESFAPLVAPGTNSERLTRLWNKYIDKMFKHRPLRGVSYSRYEAQRWLIWLANALVTRQMSGFQLDRLNAFPRFQADRREGTGPLNRVPSYYRAPLWYFLTTPLIIVRETLFWLSMVVFPLGGPLRPGVLLALAYLLAGFRNGVWFYILGAISASLAFTSFLGRTKLGSMDHTGFRTVEKVAWSRETLAKQWIRPFIDGILYGIAGGLVASIKIGILNGFWRGVFFGLICAVVGCLLAGISVGYDPALALTRNRPDIGIWRSGRNAIWFGSTAGLVGLVAGAEVGYAAAGKPGALALGLGSAVGASVGVGARMGGGAWDVYWMNIYHLCKARLGPWKYAQFLEEMTERLLLVRAGRAFEFIHIQLRDHFAEKYINTGGFIESGMIKQRRRNRFRVYQATGRYSRFDDTAWQVWELAEAAARQANNEQIEPIHLLLGLSDKRLSLHPQSILTAREADSIRWEARMLLEPGVGYLWGDMPLAADSKHIFHAAHSHALLSRDHKLTHADILYAIAFCRDPLVAQTFHKASIDAEELARRCDRYRPSGSTGPGI